MKHNFSELVNKCFFFHILLNQLYDLQNQDLTTNHLSVKDRAGVHGKARVSSVTDKNDLTKKTSTMKEEPVVCRKKRETLENKECIKRLALGFVNFKIGLGDLKQFRTLCLGVDLND